MTTFPFKAEDLDKETDEAVLKAFKGLTKGVKIWRPFGLCMPAAYSDYAERIYNMEVRPDDVWVVTFPKTGTTWTQATIWSILNDGRLDLLKGSFVLSHWRFLGLGTICKDSIENIFGEKVLPEEMRPALAEVLREFEKAVEDPPDKRRLIKTHLPFPFLPPNLLDTAKVVYVARNPRDTCVSYYHHNEMMRPHGFVEDFASFFDYFIKDLVAWSPYWPHVIDAWNRRSHPNMFFLFYEDLKKNFPGVLRRLADFLQKPITEQLVEKLTGELSAEEMRRNPALNYDQLKHFGILKNKKQFVRKGVVGDWKNYFTPEMEKRMNEWSAKEREGSDIKFPGEE